MVPITKNIVEADAKILLVEGGGLTKCILACMVHRCNKEITTSCLSLPAGQSREVQRNNAAARVSAERAAAKKARKKQDDEDLRVRRIRANIGEMSLIKSRNDLVATQLQLYNNNNESFIAARDRRHTSIKL